jgi:Protein of unknown function (DUF2934)
VPKKSKVDPAGSAKMTKAKAGGRSTKTKKSLSRKKVAVRTEAVSVARTAFDPTDEQIQMRAYFISERRRRLALPGDANSDWLEAKRQLLSETRL